MKYYYRNIKNEYEKISYEEYSDKIFDEDPIVENNREVILVNKEHKQSIIFHEYRFESEEKLTDVCDIPNYISQSAYDYICDVLNKHDNITVFWSQVYGTTSDYTIIYGHYFTDREQCKKYIMDHENDSLKYKYVELSDDTCNKCIC